MSERIDTVLESVPDGLQADVRRLFDISPLFALLMRTADEDACRQLFVPADKALLPGEGGDWVPPCDSHDVAACMVHLRHCKQRAHRHLIWWELGLHGDMGRSCRAIADLATALLDAAVTMAALLIAPRYGRLEGGSFCVIGLGKLGGRELNLGSDVDPLFIWQGAGRSTGGRQSLPAAEYYRQLSRMLIRLMGERTADGMVWPVDMRLRPGGDAAAICLSLDATLDHYLEYGQTWERAMLIKARPVAGDIALGEQFVAGIAPFIYRRYLDYTTVAALAEMKRRIDAQAGVQGIGSGFDVKRGRGAIREIEFIIQSLQLLHGGRNAALRVQPSMQAITVLHQAGVLLAADSSALKQAYHFWRRIEHAIQARRGEQTHKLPDDFMTYLPAATGIQDIAERMAAAAALVGQMFTRFVKPVDADMDSATDREVAGGGERTSWLLDPEAGLGAEDEARRERYTQALRRLDGNLLRGLLPERSRAQIEHILARAMPHWLDDANGVAALESFAELVHAIAGRATWIDLLATHEGALEWLIGALSASRYLADHIVRDPSWLEWPLAMENSVTDVDEICQQLRALDRLDDVQQTLADIGRWVDRGRLLAALAVDAHTADAMTVGGWLADVADAATQAVLRLCLHEMALPADFPFVALAMGKHGSREMGLVSDLDMVFVLAHKQPRQLLGRRSLGEHAQRIGRRMILYLTGKPPFGAGYAFDARLRPSGCSGVLVTSLAGFDDYQHHQAQTWEHQALCRGRAVAGPADCRMVVEQVIDDVLAQPRDNKALAADVRSMRQKMLDHLSSKSAALINLKQDAGGVVDIEFLAQYARLAFHIRGRRVVDVLQDLPAEAPELWRSQADFLAESYRDYRQMENALRVELWCSVGALPSDADAPEWETLRRHTVMGSPQALRERMQLVHQIFHTLLGC